MGWKWVNRQALVTLRDMSLAEHGGASGIRDQGLLASALVRQNIWPHMASASRFCRLGYFCSRRVTDSTLRRPRQRWRCLALPRAILTTRP